jgi:hypothetical protein
MATIDTTGLIEFCKEMTGYEPESIYGSIITAAQHDIINKFLQTNPQRLQDLVEVVAITSIPHTIGYDWEGLRVFVNDNECKRVPGKERIANQLSIMNDAGKKFYYYMVGDMLYIYPYSNEYYNVVHEIVINDESGELNSYQGSAKHEYAVNLYYAQSLMFKLITEEITNIQNTDLFPVGTYTALDFTGVDARLTDDDIEMLGGEIEKLNTILKQHEIDTGVMQTRNLLIQNMFARLNAIRAMYLEYFGIGGKE